MSTNTLRAGLAPLPPKMAHLPIDERGFPVPAFVAIIDGKPDHRCIEPGAVHRVLNGDGHCWICGTPAGAFKSFVIGPMSSITRTMSEPPSHRECARYAAMNCPFLARPHAKRRDNALPEGHYVAEGHADHNPGVMCVWTTKTFVPYRDSRGSILFELGEPTSTDWYCAGRAATRAEVDAGVALALPLLADQCRSDDDRRDLARRVAAASLLLDGVLPERTGDIDAAGQERGNG